MKLTWKYTNPVKDDSLRKIENKLNVKFPDDYKNIINDCNSGKPSKDCFDIHNRKECVLDYMLGVNESDKNPISTYSIEMWNSGLSKHLLPIALDPFGNIIAYKTINEGNLKELVFWEHENRKEIYIAKSFTIFLQMLY